MSDALRGCAGFSVGEISYPANLYQPRHAHPNATVTLVLSGSLEERVGTRSERGLALGIVVKPAGVEHDDRFGTAGARTVQLGVTDDAARRLAKAGETLGAWRWVTAGAAVASFLDLYEAFRSGASAPQLQARAWDVLAALDGVDTSAGPRSDAAPRWLARVREQVDDTPAAVHRVGELAASAGVHPVHLAREFRRCYGGTLSAHLQRRRLQAAAELLIESEQPIAAVAERAGYADQSHLGRQLRARTGVSPAQLRRAARPMLQSF
jgi:AraC family transcriptional regulator